jgi:hypothetical protein
MIEQDRAELLLVGEQRFDGSLWELGKCGVRRREHGERALPLQGLDEPCRFHRGDEGGKASRVDGDTDDVLWGLAGFGGGVRCLGGGKAREGCNGHGNCDGAEGPGDH